MGFNKLRNNGYRDRISGVLLYTPLIFGLILMLPRIASPQFGFFDDAHILTVSQRLLEGDFSQLVETGSGRFRPFYWLFPFLIFVLVRMRPFWFFIANTLLLTGTTAGIVYLMYRLTNSRTIAWWSGTFFVLSGPIIEGYYTLSKGEPLQLTWILISLLTLCFLRRAATRKSKVVNLGLVSIFTFLAIISKETSLVMLPISAVWFLGSLIGEKVSKTETDWKIKGFYLAATLAGAGIYVVLRFLVMPLGFPEEGYTSNFVMDTTRLLSTLKVWERWLNRDFFYLAPLGVLPILNLIRLKRIEHTGLLFDTIVWMAGWLLIFLPWVFQLEYYLVPFAMGSSIMGGILLDQTIKIAKRSNMPIRLLAVGCILAATFLFIVTLPNNLTNARLQLAIDKSNAEMLAFIVDEIPTDATLLINIQEPNQYVRDIKIWISELMNRADIRVEHFQFQTIGLQNSTNALYYIAAPFLENQYYQSVRLGVTESTSKAWNQSMLSSVGESAEIVFESRESLRLSIVDIRFGCLVIDNPAYCDIPTVPLDSRVLSYGWKIYRVPVSQ